MQQTFKWEIRERRNGMKKLFFVIGLVLLVHGIGLGVAAGLSQPYPSHPIQLVIPGAPGDAQDVVARSVAEELTKILKAPVIPVNKPGGATMIGTDFVAKSKKDGYTLLYSATSGVVYSPAVSPETTPYHPLRDLEPLGMHVVFPSGMWVQTESPWKNLSDAIEHARKNPGKFRSGTNGVGSTSHFQLEIIKSLTDVDIPMIPFKGAAPAVTGLLGGHIESASVAVALVFPHYKSAKIRGLVVDMKVPDMPEVPTLRQLGYKRDLPVAFWAFFSPVGIPEEARKVLVPAIEKMVKNPKIIAKLQNIQIIPNYKSPAELKAILTDDYENAREMAKKMGLTK
jgi:tripartite-type tricarboxylate transporter receptor subunit TctC